MYEDGVDYIATSKSYSFAQFARGSTVNYVNYNTRHKKPNRKKEKTMEDLEAKRKKYFEEKELEKYYKAKHDKSEVNDGKPLEQNCAYIIGDRYFTYLGEFNSVKDVPNTTCCFAIGDTVYTKNQVFNEFDKQFVKTEPLYFPKSFLSKLGMKDYSDKPDLGKALEMIFEGKMTWNTFDKICKTANVEYRIQLMQKEE